jgi:protein gp37
MSDQRDGGISWTDHTWNPLRGCSRVSAGCVNCYAETQAARFAGVVNGKPQPYHGLITIGAKGPRWNGMIKLVPERLGDPLHWKRPRKIFVNSMSDLFHENAPREYVASVLGVIAMSGHHTFQVLTKRPARMRELMDSITLEEAMYELARSNIALPSRAMSKHIRDSMIEQGRDPDWEGPMCDAPWLWLGVSAEDQVTANERVPRLLATRAAVRFVSYEPAIGPIDVTSYVIRSRPVTDPELDAPDGALVDGMRRSVYTWEREVGIDWIIVGGESGLGARPFDITWARAVVEQARGTGCAVFVKQLGADPYMSPGPITWPTTHSKGGDLSEWPEDLRVQEFPR